MCSSFSKGRYWHQLPRAVAENCRILTLRTRDWIFPGKCSGTEFAKSNVSSSAMGPSPDGAAWVSLSRSFRNCSELGLARIWEQRACRRTQGGLWLKHVCWTHSCSLFPSYFGALLLAPGSKQAFAGDGSTFLGMKTVFRYLPLVHCWVLGMCLAEAGQLVAGCFIKRAAFLWWEVGQAGF